MNVTVQIPTALRGCVDEKAEITVSAQTVASALSDLVAGHRALQPHLFDADGSLRSFINLYVNEEHVRYLDQLETKLEDGDILTIVPAMAGGETPLNREELARYSRHLIIPEVGLAGQQKLKHAKVLCLGAGGLGSPVSIYLAAAGVGHIGLVDFDTVDATNLQRQILHGTKDVGRSKLASAQETLSDINPHVQLDLHETHITSDNALALIEPYDLVIDGTDNFPTRYLINDACVLLGKPNVYGAIYRFEGQASVFWSAQGPCYRCLYPEPPPPGMVPSCAEGGVLGILPGIIGVIQATEAIKLLLGKGDSLAGRLLTFDALTMKFREFKLRKDPDCPICGENPTVTALIDYEQFCGHGANNDALRPDQLVTVSQLKSELDENAPLLLLDVREPYEVDICKLDPSTLIPLGELPNRLDDLNRDANIVAICRSGARSETATRLLHASGFTSVRNLVGGLLAWSSEIDPSMPRY